MDKSARSTMEEIVELNHGPLREFANAIKGKLTRNGSPSVGDFTDAVFDAALELMAEPAEKAEVCEQAVSKPIRKYKLPPKS